MGEHSERVGEGSVEGKHGHVPPKETIEARKDAYVREREEKAVCVCGGGGGWK